MFPVSLMALYFIYTLFSIGTIHRSPVKNRVFLGLTASISIIADLLGADLLTVFFHSADPAVFLTGSFVSYAFYIGWFLVGVLVLFFDLFYDQEGLLHQWPYLAFPWIVGFTLNEAPLWIVPVFALSLAVYRRELKTPISYLRIALYTAVLFLPLAGDAEWLRTGLQLFLWIVIEWTRYGYRSGYERSTHAFQQRILLHQYEEIKEMYLNMRGWRHDFHNHIQSVNAYLALNQTEEAKNYLADLDKDLTEVDSYIRSGHLLADAILNSKLSIAEKNHIRIHCTAQLPERLLLSDTDLCVLLGNLLDNAIEACKQIEPEKRFLRIYMALNKQQIYISIQNSAKEILNFNERHYITSKRGQHGLGLMRVKLLVDKYEGYLNLQNEPGIFAAEVTIPNQ